MASFIEKVEVPQLEQFLRDLSALLGKGIAVPPTHVTLYTRGTEKGIAIPNQAVWKELVKARVRADEIQAVDNPLTRPGSDQESL